MKKKMFPMPGAVRRTVSGVLCLSTILLCLPLQATALNKSEDGSGSGSDARISVEYEAKRGEFEKHYLLSDGSFAAVSYAEPVHYQKDGEWIEADLRLSPDRASSRLSAENGDYTVSFSGNGSGDLACVSSGDQTLSWSLALNDSASTRKMPNAARAAIDYTAREDAGKDPAVGKKISDEDAFASEKLSGQIRYTGLFPQNPEISVQYTAFLHKVEEDIWIDSPTEVRSFSLILQTGSLTAKAEGDGSVTLFDPNGEKAFRIGIPYLEDAKGEVLNAIRVDLEKDGDQTVLTYTPDASWLADPARAYPILLDPSITTREYNSNISDTYVAQNDTANHSSEQKLYIGIKSSKIHRSYLKINNLPNIDPDMPLIEATMQLRLSTGTTTGKTADLYRASSSWTPSSITYANQPSLNSNYLIDSCAYSSSSTYYTFDFDSILGVLYSNHGAGIDYGYVLKYADESFNNPDYNAVYSVDCNTASYRPLLTIQYGYALPSSLLDGGVYAIKNLATNKYMTVHNGTDANDVNVYQQTVSSFSNLTSKHKFKIDYVPSTGGYFLRAMCSSNGTNRVLDIVRSGGYVNNGGNVQIYNPTDTLAQHWFIIGMGGVDFRIVPRTNMALALTAYPSSADGTSSGTGTSSPGNIFVSTFEDYDWPSESQLWMFIDQTGEYMEGVSQGVQNANYYFNNQSSGKYLHKSNSTSVNGASGLISSLGDSIRWKVEYAGYNKYTVRALGDTTKYLYGSGNTVSLAAAPSGGLTDNYKWYLFGASGGGLLIRNASNNYYLYASSSTSLALSSSLGDYGSDVYNKRVWRTVKTTVYGNTNNYQYNELSVQSTFNNIESTIRSFVPLHINTYLNNEIWISPSDFDYTIEKSNIASFENNMMHCLILGGTKVTAVHKISNRVKTFYILSGFSTTATSTPLPDTIQEDMIEPYNVWPASEDSQYYGCTDVERIVALSSIYATAELMISGGEFFNYPAASHSLQLFLNNDGETYNLNFKQMLNEWDTAQAYRTQHINGLMTAVESTATYSNQSIRTICAIGNNANGHSNWGYAIGKYYVSIACTYCKTDVSSYSMQVTYELHDFYNWDRNDTSMGNLPLSPSQLWELHHGGYAKNYLVHGQNTFTLTWSSGQTFENGAVMSNET